MAWVTWWVMKITAIPRFLGLEHDTQNVTRLLHAQRRRRLIEYEDASAEMNCAGDSKRLAFTAREPSNQSVTVVDPSDAETLHRCHGNLVGLFAVEYAERSPALGGFDTDEERSPESSSAGKFRRIGALSLFRGRRRPSACRRIPSSPSMKISPEVGLWTPAKVLINVDLPAPLSPKRQRTSPASTFSEMLWSTSIGPNDLLTDLSSNTGWGHGFVLTSLSAARN